jgi:hypothetical protein
VIPILSVFSRLSQLPLFWERLLWIAALLLSLAGAGALGWKLLRWKPLLVDRQILLDEIAALHRALLARAVPSLRSPDDGPAPSPDPVSQPGPSSDSPSPPEPSPLSSGSVRSGGAPAVPAGGRFPGLSEIDRQRAEDSPVAWRTDLTLSDAADQLHRYAAAHLGIYTDRAFPAYFLAAMAVSDLVLLSGERAAAYPDALCKAFGPASAHFGAGASSVPVQPGWQDPSPLLGRFHPHTKQYEEPPFLRAVYEAGWRGEVCGVVLDGFTNAPPEDWFAPWLRMLDLPDRELSSAVSAAVPGVSGGNPWAPASPEGERAFLDPLLGEARRSVALAPSQWPTDPRLLRDGQLVLPETVWFFGTLPSGEPLPGGRLFSGAMELHLPAPGHSFPAPWTEALPLQAATLRKLFAAARETNPTPPEFRRRVQLLEQYLADRLRVIFGPKLAWQMLRFVPVCRACGLSDREAMDGWLAHRALRRLAAADPAALTYELPALREFIQTRFGRRALPLSMSYLDELESSLSVVS